MVGASVVAWRRQGEPRERLSETIWVDTHATAWRLTTHFWRTLCMHVQKAALQVPSGSLLVKSTNSRRRATVGHGRWCVSFRGKTILTLARSSTSRYTTPQQAVPSARSWRNDTTAATLHLHTIEYKCMLCQATAHLYLPPSPVIRL